MSWGAMMGNNRPYILQHAFTIMYPGLAIFITVLAISLVGDGLNDALNPKLRKR
jgi:peptide/nickel transport system permease protein